MKNDTRIELASLSNKELNFCLSFLSTALHKEKERKRLIAEIKNFMRPDQVRTFGINYTVTGREMPSWLVDIEESLYRVQARWRAKVRGPAVVVVQQWPDFEEYLLSSPEEFRLPKFTLRFRQIGRVGRRRLLPDWAMVLGSVDDIFEWLFLRAIANRQFLRFAHCIVCGDWSLKKIATGKSQIKCEFLKQNDQQKLTKSDFLLSIPMWPVVCRNKRCKDRFFNVARGKSRFDRKDFPGLSRNFTQTPTRFKDQILSRLTSR